VCSSNRTQGNQTRIQIWRCWDTQQKGQSAHFLPSATACCGSYKLHSANALRSVLHHQITWPQDPATSNSVAPRPGHLQLSGPKTRPPTTQWPQDPATCNWLLLGLALSTLLLRPDAQPAGCKAHGSKDSSATSITSAQHLSTHLVMDRTRLDRKVA